MHLLTEAVSGRMPVHYAILPLDRIRRFDPGHRPEITISGKKIVAEVISKWRARAPWPLWVYPSENRFTASDDYFTLAAYEQSGMGYAGCLVLGVPDGEGVAEVSGPFSVDEIKQALGFK